MLKKIKKYFELKKRYRHEVLETLATICLFLEADGRRGRLPHTEHLRGHFYELKSLAKELRGEEEKRENVWL